MSKSLELCYKHLTNDENENLVNFASITIILNIFNIYGFLEIFLNSNYFMNTNLLNFLVDNRIVNFNK